MKEGFRVQTEVLFIHEVEEILVVKEILRMASVMSPSEYFNRFGYQIRSGLANLRGNPNLKPEVSIIVPAHDEEKYILGCLKTLSRQKFSRSTSPPRTEVIVVANACNDQTVEFAERSGARVIVDPVKGFGRARKTGLLNAQGELYLFIDADCGSHPLWLDTMVWAFHQNPNLDALYGPSLFFDGNFFTYLYNILGLTAKRIKHHYQGRNCAYGKLARRIAEESPLNIMGEDGRMHKAILRNGGRTTWILKPEVTVLTSDRRIRREGVRNAFLRRSAHLLFRRGDLVYRQYTEK